MRIIPLLLVLLLLANTDASAAERLGRDVTTAGLAGSFVRPDGSGPRKGRPDDRWLRPRPTVTATAGWASMPTTWKCWPATWLARI